MKHATLTILWLICAAALGFAQNPDTLWYENWEEPNWTIDWHVTAGTWEVGLPTSGPGSAYTGEKLAATVLGGDYWEGVDSRLVRHTSFVVPSASLHPRLRFWHWFSISEADWGIVQVQVNGGPWQNVSPYYVNVSSGVWSNSCVDLSAYADSSIMIAFYFHSQQVGNYPDVSSGWYLDDVVMISGEPIFTSPEGWEQGLGDWYVDCGTWEVGSPTGWPGIAHTGSNCAATVLAGNYYEGVDSRLISPPFLVPSASEYPRLRFWQWFSNSEADYAVVQIQVGNGSWQSLSPLMVNAGSDVWSNSCVDLSGFANSVVKIGFYFHSQQVGNYSDVSSGWYIDDVALITGEPVFLNPESWEQGLGDWYADCGTWEVGSPTGWPGNAHSGGNCAATVLAGNYYEGVDSRLTSPPIVVPPASQFPRLRFWQWFSNSEADYGLVQIKTENSTWQNLSPSMVNYSSGVWSNSCVDLSAYADSTVTMAFYFHSQQVGNYADVSSGWYIDDIALITGNPTLYSPESWEQGLGDWYADCGTWEVGDPQGGPDNAYAGVNCAGTVLNGYYAEGVDSRLISPPFIVPPISLNPALLFQHWYDLSEADYGRVEIKVGSGNWQAIDPYATYTGTSSGAWTPPWFSLASYSGSTVQVGFLFHSQQVGNYPDVSWGWYVDQVTIIGYQADLTCSLSVNMLDFGTGQVGTQETQPLVIYNAGGSNLVLYGIQSNNFCFTTNFNPQDSLIPPGGNLPLEVCFTPYDTLSYTGSISIMNNATNRYVWVTGTGTSPTGISITDTDLPNTFEVFGAAPNPFNPTSTIRYQTPVAGQVKWQVFDVAGRLVEERKFELAQPGDHAITFDGSSLPSGIYLYRLQLEDFQANGKLVLLK